MFKSKKVQKENLNESRYTITDLTEIKQIIRDYYEQTYQQTRLPRIHGQIPKNTQITYSNSREKDLNRTIKVVTE